MLELAWTSRPGSRAEVWPEALGTAGFGGDEGERYLVSPIP